MAPTSVRVTAPARTPTSSAASRPGSASLRDLACLPFTPFAARPAPWRRRARRAAAPGGSAALQPAGVCLERIEPCALRRPIAQLGAHHLQLAGLAQLLLPELQQRAAGIFQLLLLLQLAVLPFQRLGLSGRRAGQASLLLLQG